MRMWRSIPNLKTFSKGVVVVVDVVVVVVVVIVVVVFCPLFYFVTSVNERVGVIGTGERGGERKKDGEE